MTSNRYGIILALMVYATGALSDDPRFAEFTTVSIHYELITQLVDGTEEEIARGYPHLLRVFLRIRNTRNADLRWVGNSVGDIEARLIDKHGQPAPTVPAFVGIPHSDRAMLIPNGSSLDWMVSHKGVSMVGDRANSAAIIVGGEGWLIPLHSLHHYSLALRVKGLPWKHRAVPRDMRERVLLFDIPATPIVNKTGASLSLCSRPGDW